MLTFLIRKMYLWLICIFLILSGNVVSQNFIFQHIETKDGLSHVTVNDIYQDEFGMMWFATRDGLNRYDGNQIKVYHSIPDDTTSLPFRRIHYISGDNNGRLYLRVQASFVVFDMKKEVFHTVVPNNVSVVGYGKKRIWLCIKDDLYVYDIKEQKLRFYYSLGKDMRYLSIDEDSNGICWICTSKGLISIDGNMTLKKYYPEVIVRKVYEDKRKNLWILTSQYLIKNAPDGTSKIYKHDPKDPESLVHRYVRTVCEDSTGYVWFGSQYGLCRINPQTDKFESFLPIDGYTSGLTHRSITCLYTDRQGTIWIGTYWGGINYLNTKKQLFRLYCPEKDGLPYSVIGKFAEDKRGDIWICTEGGGLCSYHPSTGKFVSYPREKKWISGSNIKEIMYDEKEDCLWLGSHGYQINCFDLKTKRSRVYGSFSQELFKNSNSILLYGDYGDKLLLGCFFGVCVLDIRTGNIEPFMPEEEVFRREVNMMIIDSKNRLWVATIQGLICYDLTNKSLAVYEYLPNSPSGLSSNVINVIFEDSQKRIWLGTNGSGLNLYRPETNDFVRYTKEKNKLLDNNIVAIKETKLGKILLGTNKGLSVFHVEDTVFTNYEYSRGFPLMEVNDGSLFVASDGKIYVGGVEGMTIFSEKDLFSFPPERFNIEFTRLYVNDMEVVQGDETQILKNALPFTKKIRLKSGYSVFSIEFMTDNYIHYGSNDVEYRLQGYENQWMKVRFGRTLTYTNLSPGEYTLELRAKNFPTITKSLGITIEPPFYRTIWAYILYALILAVITIWFLRQARMRFYLKTSLEFERKEKLRTEELTQSKLRFFTNISHEIKTPITLILGQTEMLLNAYNIHPVVYSKILNIQRNAQNLKNLISELLDFRKQEQGHLKLHISCLNLITFLEEIYMTFKSYAAGKNIDLQFKHTEEEINVWFDPDQMQKVVNNLLSNAFKYTKKEGTITISVKEWDKDVEFSVSDTGKGILPDELKNVFDRFYQVYNMDGNLGTGIGLALSKGIVEAHHGQIKAESIYGEGSVFSVRLEKGDRHFGKEVKRMDPVVEMTYYEQALPDNSFMDGIKRSQKEIKVPRFSVLIVEDNEDLRNLLFDVFSSIYKVEVAIDGLDGWNKVREIHPDIVVSDIMMPNMSGIELCAKIKDNFDTSHIPVVLLTAKTAVEHKFEGLRIGADDYVTKPFDVKLLVLRCNNLLNNRELLKRKYVHDPEFKSPQLATSSSDLDLLDRATEIVLHNMRNPIFDVDIFSKEMGVGRTTLFNKLKGITGLSPNQFYINIRLKKAAEMLINNPDLNIADIAYDTGFSSPHYFNRCFKDLFGCAPMIYRKNNIKK